MEQLKCPQLLASKSNFVSYRGSQQGILMKFLLMQMISGNKNREEVKKKKKKPEKKNKSSVNF